MTTGSWFVFFKAARCPHCKRIAPEFEELSLDEELKELGIVFASVDVPSNRATSVRFGIRYVKLGCF
jgi:thiol-disulfide isomerase/thioredoxin